MCTIFFFKLCIEMGVLYSNYFSLIIFVQLDTWFLYLIWVVSYMFCVVCSMLFYSCTSSYNFLCYCILLFYCAVYCYLFFCVLLLVVYVYLTVYNCTLTLAPGVKPIAFNKYLSNNTLCRVQTTQRPVCTVQFNFIRHL